MQLFFTQYKTTWLVRNTCKRLAGILLNREGLVLTCERVVEEDGVQSTLFCIFDHCYFISSPNKLKICHTIKQPYIHNIMPKHENNAFQTKFHNQKEYFFCRVCHMPCLKST